MGKSASKWRFDREKSAKRPRRKFNAVLSKSITPQNIELATATKCHYWKSIKQSFPNRVSFAFESQKKDSQFM